MASLRGLLPWRSCEPTSMLACVLFWAAGSAARNAPVACAAVVTLILFGS